LIGPFKAPFLKRDSCVSLCVGVAPWENGRVVIKIWSAHFVSLPAWHALHSVGEIVYDGSANDDKSFFRMLPAPVADRVPENAVSFSSARTTQRFPLTQAQTPTDLLRFSVNVKCRKSWSLAVTLSNTVRRKNFADLHSFTLGIDVNEVQCHAHVNAKGCC
jgi:hypothetical protein